MQAAITICFAGQRMKRASPLGAVLMSGDLSKKRPRQLDAPVLPGMAGVIEDTGASYSNGGYLGQL